MDMWAPMGTQTAGAPVGQLALPAVVWFAPPLLKVHPELTASTQLCVCAGLTAWAALKAVWTEMGRRAPAPLLCFAETSAALLYPGRTGT